MALLVGWRVRSVAIYKSSTARRGGITYWTIPGRLVDSYRFKEAQVLVDLAGLAAQLHFGFAEDAPENADTDITDALKITFEGHAGESVGEAVRWLRNVIVELQGIIRFYERAVFELARELFKSRSLDRKAIIRIFCENEPECASSPGRHSPEYDAFYFAAMGALWRCFRARRIPLSPLVRAAIRERKTS
jgi:hypothetical protein